MDEGDGLITGCIFFKELGDPGPEGDDLRVASFSHGALRVREGLNRENTTEELRIIIDRFRQNPVPEKTVGFDLTARATAR